MEECGSRQSGPAALINVQASGHGSQSPSNQRISQHGEIPVTPEPIVRVHSTWYSCRVNNVLSQFSGDMREKKFIVKKKFVLPLFQNRVFPLVLTVLS